MPEGEQPNPHGIEKELVESTPFANDLDTRIDMVSHLWEGLSKKSHDELINSIDGRTIMSVLLGLKPALFQGTGWRPNKLTSEIIQTFPNQFGLSHNYFFDTLHIIGVLEANQDIFPNINTQDVNSMQGLGKYIESQTYTPQYPISTVNALLMEFGFFRPQPDVEVRLGTILGFPKKAVEFYAHKDRKDKGLGYHKFGYNFIYSPTGQEEINEFDKKLTGAYEHASKRLPFLNPHITRK